jgi:glycine/D-amino acid oxidase-like deaminating enzyme
MTPDGQPILDREAEHPAIVYACGFSRNGVLVAPLAGECAAALAVAEEPLADLRAFQARRFDV